jgi:oligopeptide/dipeptide ABC transporter ATP-binding protein
VALVGESGCGKSATALAVMGLIEPPGRIAGGSVRLQGRELVGLPEAALRAVRGAGIGMVFQDPMVALNPVFRIGDQVAEALLAHERVAPAAATQQALTLLRQVGIPDPEGRFAQYPHELSGGMQQRVMIAIAIACEPSLLIADEPTTALDVTIQAQILALLGYLQRDRGMAVLLITHNLGVVAHFAQRVVVMYAGRIAERAPTAALFHQAAHPYTRALLESLPRADRDRRRPLAVIQGSVPPPREYPPGCRFAGRCPVELPRCAGEAPPRRRIAADHEVACWQAPDPDRS